MWFLRVKIQFMEYFDKDQNLAKLNPATAVTFWWW